MISIGWSGSDEHLQGMLLADDAAEHGREHYETADADDDADEFVEWNEGDGNIYFYQICTSSSKSFKLHFHVFLWIIFITRLFLMHSNVLKMDLCTQRQWRNGHN